MGKLDSKTWAYSWQPPRLAFFGANSPDNYDGAFADFRAEIEYREAQDLESASLDASGRNRLCSLIEGQGFTVTDSRPVEYM